jgi:CRP-like cAMP-binding protein
LVLGQLPMRQKTMADGEDIVREGDRPTESCLVIEGMACRYKLVAGGQRQIVSLHFSGDIPDLQSLLIEKMDHGLSALTPIRLGFIPHDAIRIAMSRYEGVRAALFKHTLVDASIFRQWLANVGRRSALQRIACLFCECYVRSKALGLTREHTFELPLTQTELGDATGLSAVHVNRTLQQLRHSGLIKTTGAAHTILNWHELREVGDFDASYLHLRASHWP